METGNRDIEICYFLEGSYFSKSKGRRTFGEEGTLIEIMDKAAVSCFGNEEFLYVTSLTMTGKVLSSKPPRMGDG